MEKDKILKMLSGFGIGLGVGTCFGVAMNNIWLGLGVGACYATAFTANKPEDKDTDKKEDKKSEEDENKE